MPPTIISRRRFAGLLGKRRMLWRFLGGRLRSALLGSRLGEHGLELVDMKVGGDRLQVGLVAEEVALDGGRHRVHVEAVLLL